jgi:hypothetical protein
VTSQGLISDGQARSFAVGIKRRYHDRDHIPDFDALNEFIATGAIVDPAGWEYCLHGALGPWAPARGALLAYVAFHGERGPVSGWGER